MSVWYYREIAVDCAGSPWRSDVRSEPIGVNRPSFDTATPPPHPPPPRSNMMLWGDPTHIVTVHHHSSTLRRNLCLIPYERKFPLWKSNSAFVPPASNRPSLAKKKGNRVRSGMILFLEEGNSIVLRWNINENNTQIESAREAEIWRSLFPQRFCSTFL